MRRRTALAVTLTLPLALACGGGDSLPTTVVPGPSPGTVQTLDPTGRGDVATRYTGELWVQGATAYTTTWGARAGVRGNATFVWDVTGPTPTLVDSLIVDDATTLGDVQTTDDGTLLVVATERANGSIAIYDARNARHPVLITRYQTAETSTGVHTATVANVGGKLYGFLCIDPDVGKPAKLLIVDLSTPSSPTTVWSQEMGAPFIHDVFVRDGLLFTAEWDDGLGIWDIGGGGAGGSPTHPVRLSRIATVNGEAHNVWWFHDPSANAKRYAFVGEEGPGQVGFLSSGDIHVVDVSNLRAPREVAFFHVEGAGTHNFSMDEARGVLYAAYYNGGVRALAVRGDLSSCDASARASDGRCDLGKMGREVGRALVDSGRIYVWGVQWTSGGVYASDMLNGLWRFPQVQ